MSWWRAASVIVSEGWASALVLEDDAAPLRPGHELLEALAALPEHDVALLHDQDWPALEQADGGHTDDFLRVTRCTYCTCAVHLTQSGARKLLAALAPVAMPIDVWLRENPAGLTIFQPRPGRAFFRHDGWFHTTVREVPCPPIPRVLHRILDGTEPPGALQDWLGWHEGWELRTRHLAALPGHLSAAPAMLSAATLLMLWHEGGVVIDPALRCGHSFAALFGSTSVFLGPAGHRLSQPSHD